MASFRVYGKGHSIRARGVTRVPNYPTYPVYLPYPERVIPPGHETPKISAYFNIRINSALFGRVIPSGHERKPRPQNFSAYLISGTFYIVLLSSIRKGSFHQGTRHDIRLIPYTLHFRSKLGRPIRDEDFGWGVVFFYHHLNLAQHLIMCLFLLSATLARDNIYYLCSDLHLPNS